MLPTSLPGGSPARDDRRRARPRHGAASAARRGMRAASSGVRPPSSGNGTSAQPSGTNTTYFIAADHTGGHALQPAAVACRQCSALVRPSRCRCRSHSLVIVLAACSSSSTPKSATAPPIPPTSPAPTTTSTAVNRRLDARRLRPRRRGPRRPTSRRVHIELTPCRDRARQPDRPRLARARHRTCSSPNKPAGCASSTPAASCRPTPVLTVGPLSHGNEEGLLGITFSPDGTKLYVDYTDPSNDTHVDEYTMRGEVAVASSRAGSCSWCSSRTRTTRAVR